MTTEILILAAAWCGSRYEPKIIKQCRKEIITCVQNAEDKINRDTIEWYTTVKNAGCKTAECRKETHILYVPQRATNPKEYNDAVLKCLSMDLK